MVDWEDIYAGYVIFDRKDNTFIGPTGEMAYVRTRSMASRFKKKEALEYLETGWLVKEKNGADFEIQDAL